MLWMCRRRKPRGSRAHKRSRPAGERRCHSGCGVQQCSRPDPTRVDQRGWQATRLTRDGGCHMCSAALSQTLSLHFRPGRHEAHTEKISSTFDCGLFENSKWRVSRKLRRHSARLRTAAARCVSAGMGCPVTLPAAAVMVASEARLTPPRRVPPRATGSGSFASGSSRSSGRTSASRRSLRCVYEAEMKKERALLLPGLERLRLGSRCCARFCCMSGRATESELYCHHYAHDGRWR